MKRRGSRAYAGGGNVGGKMDKVELSIPMEIPDTTDVSRFGILRLFRVVERMYS